MNKESGWTRTPLVRMSFHHQSVNCLSARPSIACWTCWPLGGWRCRQKAVTAHPAVYMKTKFTLPDSGVPPQTHNSARSYKSCALLETCLHHEPNISKMLNLSKITRFHIPLLHKHFVSRSKVSINNNGLQFEAESRVRERKHLDAWCSAEVSFL